MYRHIVLFWLKDSSEKNLIVARDKLRSLAGKIEGLLTCEVEMDALHSDRSCHLCLNMVFDSKAALDAYRTHPAHLPVQAHMHAVRTNSHSADYPIAQALRRMPLLYASFGPACANADVLARLMDEGMAGIRLSLTHRSLAEALPWIEAYYTAAAHSGIPPNLILDLSSKKALPQDIKSYPPSTLLLSLPHGREELASFIAPLASKFRVMAKAQRKNDVEAIPLWLSQASEVVIARISMGRNVPPHEIAGVQKRISAAANLAGIPHMVAGGLLSTMRDHPFPTSAEVMDIYNAVLDGAASLMLSEETSIGKYPAESLAMLAKVARSAII